MIISGSQRIKYRSWIEIEKLAQNVLNEYDEGSIKNLRKIDEELMVEEYLEAFIDFKKLSTDMSILGASSFSGGVLHVFNRFNEIEPIRIDPHTIIIDEHLDSNEMEPRRRFTVAHEIGHLILHEDTFSVYQRCGKRQLESWDKLDTLEWQANTFAAALLMPTSTMEQAINRVLDALHCTKDDFKRRVKLDKKYYYTLVDIIAGVYGVSFTCAKIRLKAHPEFWV